MTTIRPLFTTLLLAAALLFSAGSAQTMGDAAVPVDPSLFLPEGLVTDITEEACTLSGGTETTCYRIVVTSVPSDHDAGPWCPSTITSPAEEGGIWLESGEVYDVDGSFIENLAAFYDDPEFKLYNDDGTIRITDTPEAFEAAARPDVAEEYQNHCVQGLLSYVDEDLVHTYIIPTTPVARDTPGTLDAGAVGVAFNGVNFDPPAPTDAILGAHTLAPFDDCGGHVNPVAGYHYHAHTGCLTEVAQEDGHAPLVGYALDGYGLYAHLNEDGSEPDDLDESGGHTDDIRGYHYHLADAGSNSFIDGFHGETGCALDGDTSGEACDASVSTGGPGGRPAGGGPPGDR